MEEDRFKLFRLMHQTLEKAKSIQQEAVYLTGEIRGGKSTSFNWIYKHQTLIGGGNKIKPIYNINQRISTIGDFASIKDSIQSVTLIPNIKLIENGTISLIDLPGNKDRRTQIEVMMVSFILNACFKASKRAKFIIVISNDGFMSINGQQFINAISSFVKLFAELSDQQLDRVFDSASLLITAVPISSGQYEQMKKQYLNFLQKKLQKLEELKHSYVKLTPIFGLIQKLISNLIKNKKMELFPRAAINQSPQSCPLLQQFTSNGWKFNDLSNIYEKIKFPYAEQFKELQENQQSSLRNTLEAKFRSYENLQSILADFVDIFMKSPLSIDEESFTSIFQRLEQLLEDTSYCDLVPFDSNKYQDNESDHFSSIKIIKDLLILQHFTFEINFDNDRSEESKAKESYFGYLKGYFIRTIQIFKNCFSRKGQENYVMDNILTVFSQGFDFLTLICSIEPSIKSTAHHRLKQAISVMNTLSYTSNIQIKSKYFQKLSADDLTKGSFEDSDEIKSIIEMLQGQKPEDYHIVIIFDCLEKCNKIHGQQLKDEKDFKGSLKCYLLALANSIKRKLALDYELKQGLKEEKELLVLIENVKETQKKIYKEIKEIMTKKSKDALMKEKIKWLVDNHPELQNKTTNEEPQEKYLIMVNEFMQTVIKEDFSISIDSIQQQIANYYKTKEEKIMTGNEFQIELPQKMTNYEVIAYSKFLISKVNKRKIVLLLGKKAGKSTVSYWLRGKELTKTTFQDKGNSRIYYDTPPNSKLQKRISRSQIIHTEVPNIYNLNQAQLLVDCPHIYNIYPQKTITAGYITKSLILSSSQCKFILVIKETDIIDNQSVCFIEQLVSYIDLFQDIKKKQTLFNGLIILVTFGNPNNMPKLRQAIKFLYKQFQSPDNLEIIIQKYKIPFTENYRKKMHALLNEIYRKQLYCYFDTEAEHYKRKLPMIEQLSKQWIFSSIDSNNLLSCQRLCPLFSMRNQQQNELLQKIKDTNQFLGTLGNIMQRIVLKIVGSFEKDEKANIFSQEQKLTQLISKQWLQNALLFPQTKLLKSILCPTLKQIKKKQHKSVQILSIFNSVLKLDRITSQILDNCQYQFNWLGSIINEVLYEIMPILMIDSSQPKLYETIRIKTAHQIAELSVLHEQITALKQIQKDTAKQLVYQKFYQRMFSEFVKIKGQFCLVNYIDINTFMHSFEKKFDLKQFQEAAKTDPAAINLLYQFLISLNGKFNKFNLNFRNSIFNFYAEKSENNQKCLKVLCRQAQMLDKQNQSVSQQQIVFQLITILQKMSLKMVAIDSNFALEMCDWHNNLQTKRQIFKIILQSQEEKKPIVFKYLEFLIDIGYRKNQIYQVFNKYQLLLSPEQQEEWKRKILNNIEISLYHRQTEHTIKQLQQYISKVNAKI